MAQSNKDAAFSSIADQTDTHIDVVKSLYQEHFAELESTATIKTFIGVIATGRVKRQLRSRRAKAANHRR